MSMARSRKLGNGLAAIKDTALALFIATTTSVLLGAQPGAAQPANRLFAHAADIPVSGDLDGDGKTDIVIYRAGTWSVLTSRSQFTSSTTYTWGLAGGNFTLRGDYTYRSEFWFEAANTALNRQGGYGLANARATYEFGDGRWTVAAYGLNLADKFYRTNVQDVIGAGLGIAFAAVSPPREWGAELRYRFGR